MDSMRELLRGGPGGSAPVFSGTAGVGALASLLLGGQTRERERERERETERMNNLNKYHRNVSHFAPQLFQNLCYISPSHSILNTCLPPLSSTSLLLPFLSRSQYPVSH